MESSNRNRDAAFIYQRLGWDVCDGGAEADDPFLIPDDIAATLEPINDNGETDTALAALKDAVRALKEKSP